MVIEKRVTESTEVLLNFIFERKKVNFGRRRK